MKFHTILSYVWAILEKKNWAAIVSLSVTPDHAIIFTVTRWLMTYSLASWHNVDPIAPYNPSAYSNHYW